MRFIEIGATILIVDDDQWPDWYPFDMFELIDNSLPVDWEVGNLKNDEGENWVFFGYPEMVQDEDHHDLLIERDISALRIFFGYVEKYKDIY
ncbi:hypothetical protein [Actinopolyspora mortivallis]|nr:hypothetical protein [Actinopolyspora mortivallis]